MCAASSSARSKVARIARLSKSCPVAPMVFSRKEEFYSTVRHPYRMKYRTGLKKDGTILARKIEIISNSGPYVCLGKDTLTKALGNIRKGPGGGGGDHQLAVRPQLGQRHMGFQRHVLHLLGGKLGADISYPNMLYAAARYSDYAHARILSVDVSGAERSPGVRAVITAKDVPVNRFGYKFQDQPVLADDKVYRPWRAYSQNLIFAHGIYLLRLRQEPCQCSSARSTPPLAISSFFMSKK